MERIPILRMGKYLLVTIQIDMQDQTALLLQEDLEAVFEVAAHEALHGIAVETDDLRQESRGEDRLSVLFVLGDDLQQHRAGQVLVGLGVADFEGLAGQHQLPHFLQRDVAGDAGVVETTVGVFLDDPG